MHHNRPLCDHSSKQRGPLNKVRLIILDDDPQIGRAIRDIAESAGAQALFTTETAAFFGAVDKWRPTHIALDLVMPEMDGLEVLAKLAERKSSAKIIISSGLDSRVLDAASRSANERGLSIAGILSKPFSPGALRALLSDSPVDDQSFEGRPAEPINNGKFFEVTAEEMRRALASRELQLVYQPQIECANGRLAGFEALVRWVHPRHGVIMPDHFIAFAESHNLIDELTKQVLELGIAWIVKAFPATKFTLSVNMSSRTAPVPDAISATPNTSDSLISRIKTLCHTHGFDPSKLVLELTETSAMQDPASSLDLLTRLRMNAVQLSLDDFGTGYSSMVQLVRLPFSEIKIDKSFVMTAVRSPESRAVVKSIVELGHSLELRVVAEGVEDADSLRYLQDIGCDLAQGYLIGRPMSGDAILEWTIREASRLVPDAAQHSFL